MVSSEAPEIAPTGLITGVVQVYNVPTGVVSPPELSGIISKVTPLQIVSVLLLILGV